MMEPRPDNALQTPLTPHEEQVWLLQQQYPEQRRKHFSAWSLGCAFDTQRLEAALRAVIDALPALNARYLFDDEGELRKVTAEDWQACVAVLQVDTPARAGDLLLDRQASPWDAETQAPLAALVIQTGQGVILGFVLHEVLDQTCREDDLYRLVMDAYDGRPVGVPHLPWLVRQAIDGPSVASPPADPRVSSDADAMGALILAEFRNTLAEPGMTLEDDFFEFGGHSLLATRIIGKLADSHGVEVDFNDFFSASTAAALAQRARRREQRALATAASSSSVQTAPFAPAQASLGRAYAAFDFGTIFNLPFAVAFREPVDEAVFEQAFHDLVERHASLRTTFHFDEGEPYQRQVPVERLGQYRWFWSSQHSEGASLASEAQHVFDLSRELPMRVRFLRDGQQAGQTLSLLVHHMAIDEWSLNVMMQDLSQAYAARAADRAPVWHEPAPAFHEYATRARIAGIDPRHLAYWTDMLAAATRGLQLPDHANASGARSTESGTQAQWFEILPNQALTDDLQRFARHNNASLFGVLYTAIALALHKVGGLEELVIGTSASGRTDPAYYNTVGYFTTMVAHRVRFDAQQALGSVVEAVSSLINDSMAYADVPLEQIQQALGMTPADGLLFDVYIQIHANNALNGALRGADGEAIRYRQIDPEKSQSMFGMQFEIMENMVQGQRSLRLVVTYQTARYSAAQMDRVSRAIEQVLAAFTDREGAKASVGQLSV
ncbi:non ribosomal peptide synthetase BasB [Pseudomonas sp. CFBP 8770]|uniref:condensation domain-containing protein n=1 Tax=unclassified Pseudomonas TaxID=196821 RepID=UPI0017802AD5|nr:MULTISPECIES: condensation domain-containing protein [unclassified Pseudomonas]MBD8472863.1 non ribosomal peptide synthetase BasB [Pseudomonas sp. CFBP 8773]MBD8646034.1 non ribosomal peptide synthetase BasB [Pseudomonas sp. CFBP 8770]